MLETWPVKWPSRSCSALDPFPAVAPPLQPQWTGHPRVSVYHGLSVAIPCIFWWARPLDFFSAAKWVMYLYPEPVALHWLDGRQCSHGSVDALSSYVFRAAGFLFLGSSLPLSLFIYKFECMAQGSRRAWNPCYFCNVCRQLCAAQLASH